MSSQSPKATQDHTASAKAEWTRRTRTTSCAVVSGVIAGIIASASGSPGTKRDNSLPTSAKTAKERKKSTGSAITTDMKLQLPTNTPHQVKIRMPSATRSPRSSDPRGNRLDKFLRATRAEMLVLRVQMKIKIILRRIYLF